MTDTTPAADTHEQIRLLLSTAVPFAALVGVELLEVGDGHASARLEPRADNLNHISTRVVTSS
jgi:acyl-coenzyme A thioesterase PaaI-like protein